MCKIEYKLLENPTFYLEGKIDTTNAQEVEDTIFKTINENNLQDKRVTFIFENVEYVSSAGLRVFLKVKKECEKMKIENVSNDVYDVFEMTGFTGMIEIYKKLREVSIEGLQLIGSGYVGKVYRLDEERIIKVFVNYDSFEDIYRERNMSKKAFMLGIPTAISYEIVKVKEGGFGSIYELLKSDCFNTLLAKNPDKYDYYSKMYTNLVKTILGTKVPEGSLNSKKLDAYDWINGLKEHKALSNEILDKLEKMVKDIPDSNNVIHGDLHVKNIMLQNGEPVVIDMETLGVGHPIFELSAIFLSYIGYASTEKDNTKNFLGIEDDVAKNLYKDCLETLYGKNEKRISEIKNKIALLSYAWLAYKTYINEPENEKRLNHALDECKRLINVVDSFDF